jgi:hypothetical protein
MGRPRLVFARRDPKRIPDYFTGDSEADAFGWLDAKRSFSDVSVTA